MTLTIKIELDNAAFQDNPGELGAVLERVAGYVPEMRFELKRLSKRLPYTDRRVLDTNGNTVAHIELARQ